MNLIELNFKPPKDYRRDFELHIGTSVHRIEVRGQQVAIMQFVNDRPRDTGKILDWIQESIESVRAEFGK